MADDHEPKKKSQSQKGEPVEDPVPTRRGFFGALKKAAQDELVKRTSTRR